MAHLLCCMGGICWWKLGVIFYLCSVLYSLLTEPNGQSAVWLHWLFGWSAPSVPPNNKEEQREMANMKEEDRETGKGCACCLSTVVMEEMAAECLKPKSDDGMRQGFKRAP